MTPAERKEKERQLQELREQQEQLQSELNSVEPPAWPLSMEVNFCRSKEDNYDLNGEYVGFEDGSDAERTFTYSMLEVIVTTEVNEDGTVIATHFNGVQLPEKVNLSR
jgi:hypothetical protein